MPDSTHVFLLLLASVGFFAILGLLFGAVVASLKDADAGPAGSVLGAALAHAFNRVSEEPLPPRTLALLAAATDGFVLGAAIGLLLGLSVAFTAHSQWERLRWCCGGGLALVLAALALGLAARGLVSGEFSVLAGLFVGGLSGALLGLYLARGDGLMVGLLLGSTCGAFLTFKLRRR